MLLAAVAADPAAVPDPFEYVTQMMYEAGWASSDGAPVDRWQARGAATDTYIPLVRLAPAAAAVNSNFPERTRGASPAPPSARPRG